MSDRRTFRDEEVSEIFSLAAEMQDATPPATGARSGLTLPELQEVAREVGLAPQRVAEAAAIVASRAGSRPRRTFLGAPTGVSRTADLSGTLDEREWDMLAGELREAFGSHGRLMSQGATHEWTDGEVHAVLEPTSAGQHRLRLNARILPVTVGAVAGAFGVFAGLLSLATSALDAATFGPVLELVLPGLLVLVGGGAIALHIVRLRRWADESEDAMAQVVERAREMAATPEVETGP